MGLRDIFSRSRSKSRGRNAAPADTEDAPPVPAPPPQQEQKAEQPPPQPAEEALPPLALMRPDSRLPQDPPPKPEYEGTPYTYDGDDSLRGTSFSYDSFKAGDAPTRGTLPLPGNAPARVPSESRTRNSKSLNRTGSIASSQRRPLSEARAPSVNRRSIPPGTAVSTDRPVTQVFDFPGAPSTSSTQKSAPAVAPAESNVYTDTSPQRTAAVPVAISSRQPVQTNVQEWKTEKGPAQLDNRPAVPVVPGQFQSNGLKNAAPIQNRHDRVTSVSSRASTSSRTPIADEFASSSWYGRPGTPKAPNWSEVHGGNASPSPPPPQPSLPPQPLPPPKEPSPPLRRQPDVENFSNPSHKSVPSSSSVATDDTGAPPSRGRMPRRSYDRPLPIPKELRNAPWNRPENAHILTQTDPSDDVDAGLNSTIVDQNTSSNIPSSSRSPQISYSTTTNQTKQDIRQGQQNIYSSQPVIQGASEPPSLDGVIDTRNTTDTTTQTRWAPAVVHETVKPTVDHITEKKITREIHTHDVHHRVLPIHDVQVLPPKHYVPTSDGKGFVEVPAESIPSRAKDKNTPKHWVIAETVSKSPPSNMTALQARNFTARTFGLKEGDYEEWTGEDGVKRTKQTWIHPPAVAKAPIEKNITAPILMDSKTLSSTQEKPSRALSVPRSSRAPQIPARNSSKRVSHMRSQSLPHSTPPNIASSSSTSTDPVPLPDLRPATQSGPNQQDNAAIAANAAMEEPKVRDFADFSPSSEANARLAAKKAAVSNNANPNWPFYR